MAQRSGIGRLARMVAAAAVVVLAMAVAPTSAWALNVGDTFTAPITVGADTNVTCTFQVLSLPDGANPGTVQVGGGRLAIERYVSGDLVIPDTVSDGTTTYTVTALGDYCFWECMGLTSTGLAANSKVTTLGRNCFTHCTSLTGTGLATNSTVTSLGDNCFENCVRLTDTGLATNSKLTSMGDSCFSNCERLTGTGLATNSTVTSLGNLCFYGCEGLMDTGLAGNSTVTALGDGCFNYCTKLTSTGLARNSTVTTLGGGCFSGCTLLTSTGLATNSTVTSLGNRCFYGCTSLVDAALGSGLTSAPSDPFNSCSALKTVYFAGPYSSAKGITLPHDVDCYHLASDASWSGKVVSDVSANCSSLKALYELEVVGGTASVSSSDPNPYEHAIDGEVLVAQGETVSATATPTTGYTFSGWTSSDAGGSFADATAQSTTYALGPSAGSGTTTLLGATPISYQIHFDANGGSGTMADEDMTYDVAEALTANSLVAPAEGYHFTGWNTAVDGSGTAYADGATVSNLTATDGGTVMLFAQWAEDDPVAISYASADATMGTVSTASESVAPATGTAAGSTATARAGFRFVSWTDAGGNVASTSATLVPAKVGGAYVAAAYTANFAADAAPATPVAVTTATATPPTGDQSPVGAACALAAAGLAIALLGRKVREG